MYEGEQAWKGLCGVPPFSSLPPWGPARRSPLPLPGARTAEQTLVESVTGALGTSCCFPFSWICPRPPPDWPRGWRSGGEARDPRSMFSQESGSLMAPPGGGSPVGVGRTQAVNHFYAEHPLWGVCRSSQQPAPCTWPHPHAGPGAPLQPWQHLDPQRSHQHLNGHRGPCTGRGRDSPWAWREEDWMGPLLCGQSWRPT